MQNYQMMVDEICDLKGVEEAYIVINNSFQYSHTHQLPPMSIRVCVKGGKKKKIGKLIYKYKEIGILTVGNTEVEIEAHYGLKYHYHFEVIDK